MYSSHFLVMLLRWTSAHFKEGMPQSNVLYVYDWVLMTINQIATVEAAMIFTYAIQIHNYYF